MVGNHLFLCEAVCSTSRSLQALLMADGEQGVRERHLRSALRHALEECGTVCEQELGLRLPGDANVKSGRVGGFDLAMAGDAGVRYLAELKWCWTNKLWETLWDAFKVALATRLDGVDAAYVVVGAKDADWNKPVDCAELFDGGAWGTRELIGRYTLPWSRLLAESAINPALELPEQIRTEVVADAQLRSAHSAWTIKAIAVTPSGHKTVAFENGWPADEPVDSEALPAAQADTIRNLDSAICAAVPEDVIAWRYFSSPTLHANAERLVGTEIRDMGFIDLTLAKQVALEHLPADCPVLAAVVLRRGTLIAPSGLITGSQDADVLLARGTRFHVSQIGQEEGILTILLEAC
jgi:hypothetical protein